MDKKRTVSYDDTKKMLNTLRRLNESVTSTKVISEQNFNIGNKTPEEKSSQNVKNDITVINDVNVKLQSSDQMDMTLNDEQKTSISNMIDTFKQQVSDIADLNPGMVISRDQIRLDGYIPDLDFRFTLVAGQTPGLYVITNMTKMTPELIDCFTKFNRFSQTFTDSMNNIITQRKNN